MDEAGGVKEHVYFADPSCCFVYSVGAENIELEGFGDTGVLQIRKGLFVNVARKNMCAFARKGDRAGAADASGCCGYEGPFALQSSGHSFLPGQ
jgi:hypothetical protein